MKHPVSKVWDVLDDFAGINRWSAGVKTSPINAGTPERGVGSERLCTMYDGNHLEERVTEAVSGERLAIEVIGTSMPLKRAEGVFEVSATASGGTEVRMTFDYTMKFGVVGQAMDALMVRKKMQGSVERLLAALDEHLTTGQVIGPDWKPGAALSGRPQQAAVG